MNPDEVFKRMDAVRPVYRKDAVVPQRIREPVYIPKTNRDATYRQLMRSHDRMGTRHLT